MNVTMARCRLNKAETPKNIMVTSIKQWLLLAVTPPELTKDDERYPGHDPRYAKLSEKELPLTSSLALTIDRVILTGTTTPSCRV